MNRSFIILLIAVSPICLTHAKESDITKALKKFKIIPDVICADVPETLKVTFNSGANVDKGNIIMPTEAKDQPKVHWNADPLAFYTILCVDPDAPFPENPILAELNTWLVGNIPGTEIGLGQVLAEYIGAAPPRGADLNRYIYFVFKQLTWIDFDETPIDRHTVEGRANFSTKAFAEKYQLGSPVAANFYRSKFDNYVLELYRDLNCCMEYNQPE